MTRDRAKELLPVIQAYADGKAIEWRSCGDTAWDLHEGDDGGILGFYHGFEYRVAPGQDVSDGNTDDPVNHPRHYTSSPARCKCGEQIEAIQVCEHMGFALGNCVKYIWRADLKGNDIQDLEKSAWYLNREIARRKAAK